MKRWRQRVDDEEKLAELEVDARGSIVQAFGALALVITIAVTISQVIDARKSAERTERATEQTLRLTEQSQRLAEQGQAAERLSRAVEQIGGDKRESGSARSSRWHRSDATRPRTPMPHS